MIVSKIVLGITKRMEDQLKEIHYELFPDELEIIYFWKMRDVRELMRRKFGCHNSSLNRDISDLKGMIKDGRIPNCDCPLNLERNRNVDGQAFKTIWYYRQIVKHFQDRKTAQKYLELRGIPL